MSENPLPSAEKDVGVDYPTAWKIAARVAPEYHHNRCSYNVTSGGMLCDCDVLTKSPEYLAAYVLPPDMPTAEKDACDGCQKRPCVCETVVLPTADNDATCPRCGQHRPHGCLCHIPIRKRPCPEAAVLLDALWDLYWNGPGSCDYGDHAGYTWAEDQALTDAAERVEDHYAAHGCRVRPPGGGSDG